MCNPRREVHFQFFPEPAHFLSRGIGSQEFGRKKARGGRLSGCPVHVVNDPRRISTRTPTSAAKAKPPLPPSTSDSGSVLTRRICQIKQFQSVCRLCTINQRRLLLYRSGGIPMPETSVGRRSGLIAVDR
jgi:hypothetical protein